MCNLCKKAKPALCFARIAKAILDNITLHNSNFLLRLGCQKSIFMTEIFFEDLRYNILRRCGASLIDIVVKDSRK